MKPKFYHAGSISTFILSFFLLLVMGTGDFAFAQSSKLYNQSTQRTGRSVTPYNFLGEDGKSGRRDRNEAYKAALAQGIGQISAGKKSLIQSRIDKAKERQIEYQRNRMRNNAASARMGSLPAPSSNSRGYNSNNGDNRIRVYKPKSATETDTPTRLWNVR